MTFYPTRANDAFDAALWETFFPLSLSTIIAPLPSAAAQLTQVHPRRTIGWFSCSALSSARLDTRSAPSMESRPARANGEATLKSETICETRLADGGTQDLVFDLIVTHDCCGSSGHPLQNGLLTHPQDLHAALTVRTCLKVYGAWFLFLFLQEQIKDIIIIIVKVKAHRGKPLNERADIKAEKARPLQEECRTDESHT